MPMEVSFEQSLKILSMDDFYKKQEESKVVSLEETQNIMKTVIYKYHKIYSETVRTNDAYGRVIAEDIYSSVNVPRCCVSTKHGYAVLASDGQGVRKVLKANLMLVKKISIVPGICIRVRSGDPIPDGATAVVKSVNTKIIDEDDNENYFNIDNMEYEIVVLVAPKEGENIRKAGCEIKSNELIKYAFSRIKTADLGILTLCDIDSITVIKLPSVGLLCIGYDVLRSGNTSTLGRVYDCNKIIVSSLLKKNNYDPVDLGISAHKLDDIVNKIKNALDKVDILVIMGHTNDKDLLKPILKTYFNAMIHFGCVDMKPGKSTMFATCTFKQKMKFFLCMSANPTTVSVVTHVLLLPFLNETYCNYLMKPVNMQACVHTKHELHSRPKFSWTTLRWMETERFSRACCLQNQNIISYQKGNALLKLPSCSPNQSILEAAFVPAMFLKNL
ncbi:PREDICTED: gephyrin-like [Acromyrmex echinatior]|uniref:gephyrin-like n=1 Tax=Acromyrmex echinatior TaxID=103372 RepID=UPI000580C80C|nr:PREDICTED: gephyrin-like [Acromyrmex echinatior]